MDMEIEPRGLDPSSHSDVFITIASEEPPFPSEPRADQTVPNSVGSMRPASASTMSVGTPADQGAPLSNTKKDQDVTMEDSEQATPPTAESSQITNPAPAPVFISSQGYGLSPYAPITVTAPVSQVGQVIPPQPYSYGTSPYPAVTQGEPSTTQTTYTTPRAPNSPAVSYVTDDDDDVPMPDTPPDGPTSTFTSPQPYSNLYGFPPPVFSFAQGYAAPFQSHNTFIASPYGASPYANLSKSFKDAPPTLAPQESALHIDKKNETKSSAPILSNVPSKSSTHPPPEKSKEDKFDLLPRINGLYRLLDLYSENGSGGLGETFSKTRVS